MFNFRMEEAGEGNASGGGSGGGGAGQSAAPANIADGAGVGGQGTAAQSLGGGGGGAGQGGGDGKGWLESLPDEIRSDPSLAVFKDVAGLAKSFVNAQKMLGADKVILPTDKSTEEEWNAFYQKIGRPESPDKYEIKAPQGKELNQDLTKNFKVVAHKLGLSPKQVSGLAEWNFGALEAAEAARKTQETTQVRESIMAYQQKLGGEEKYKARVDEARVAVRALANPELSKFLKESGMGSRPEMIEFFASLKGMMDEDKIKDGTGVAFSGEDPSVIQREIEELSKKIYSDMNNPNYSTWVEQRNRLGERLFAARRPSA